MIPVLRNVSFLFPAKIFIVFIDILVWMLVFKILNNAFDGELLCIQYIFVFHLWLAVKVNFVGTERFI